VPVVMVTFQRHRIGSCDDACRPGTATVGMVALTEVAAGTQSVPARANSDLTESDGGFPRTGKS
jgi:hypothetical protein